MADTSINFTDTKNPKEFLTGYHEFQNSITRLISVDGNNSTKTIPKDRIDKYIENMPNHKALELAETLSNGTSKEKENALHVFLSNVMGNKQEIAKKTNPEEKKERGFWADLMNITGLAIRPSQKEEDIRVTTPIDYKKEVKDIFNSKLEKLADGKDKISYQVDLPNNRVRNVSGIPVDAIRDQANKYIENLSPKEATELYTKMSRTESSRTAAITEIINVSYEAYEKAHIPIPAAKPQNNQAPENSKDTEKLASDSAKLEKSSNNEKVSEQYQAPEKITVERGDTTDRISRLLLTEAAGGGKPSEKDVLRLSDALAKENNFNKHNIKPDFEIQITGEAKSQLANIAQQRASKMEK